MMVQEGVGPGVFLGTHLQSLRKNLQGLLLNSCTEIHTGCLPSALLIRQCVELKVYSN